jgi:hypothetical protein
MPQATGQFGATNVVALFQGFFVNGNPGLLVTRAAQNCQVVRTGVGQFQIQLANVTTDDCNFMIKVGQFQAAPGQAPFGVAVAFPPVADEASLLLPNPLQTFNYIQFQFYNAQGAPTDLYSEALFNVSVFSCNDGLVGLTNPATGQPFRTPGNP